ncbi:MAG: hypothetical protein M0Q24_08315 [Sulfurimonas sp.]|uniref:hypothetical protein n=1 Tax=Sulfurimonas sp. TaxID=2022749 RepID=UPI0025DBC550|nr:hypothetical protein [Sulfurimonas sp.]MCK9492081.1 hypothetical protein [Sulfurimonas sp.]
MLENIALIKEVHEHLATKDAQVQAREALAKINLQKISLYRVHMCNAYEIFCVCVVRAMMSDDKSVIIISPINLLDNSSSMDDVVSVIKKLQMSQDIVILDTLANETHYKEVSCNIVK